MAPSYHSSQVLVLGQICLLPVVLPGVPGCQGRGGREGGDPGDPGAGGGVDD